MLHLLNRNGYGRGDGYGYGNGNGTGTGDLTARDVLIRLVAKDLITAKEA